ncbi:ROK family protein [Candidatus Peregrinibacteria bacterium]|nr:ROK family protein [Candidatus Peregrinibacteria bacterium]
MNTAFLGIDVGGTKIFGVRYTSEWKIDAKKQLPTEPENGKDAVLEKTTEVISSLMTPEVKAIGIAWAGFVNFAEGIVVYAPNIRDFYNVPLTKILHDEFHVPVVIENDGRLFAFAEARNGSGKGMDHILGITFGTGVGSGIIIHGEMYRGYNGFAGEIGHTHWGSQKEKIENHFSGSGMKRPFRERNVSDILEEHFAEWDKKEGIGYDVYEALLEDLSLWLRGLILTFNPQRIILGGGIGRDILSHFSFILQEKVKKSLSDFPVSITVDIVCSEMENSGALGAAIFAKEMGEKF